MPAHVRSVIKVNNDKASYPPHFLFFFLVNLFSFFSSKISLLFLATSVILSFATVGKFIISKEIISELTLDLKYENKHLIVKILAFFLLFCFAIPDAYSFFVLKKMYLGRISSVVWHNSTTIAVFPFAILLFWQQLKVFRKEYSYLLDRDILILIALIILNILIKPSFIFVYMPVTGLFILKNLKIDRYRNFLIKLFPLLIGFLFLLIQYISIYHFQVGSFTPEKSSSVIIGEPFEFFREFIPTWYILIAFLFSFSFPIGAIAYYKEILNYKPFFYSLCLTGVGILISAFIVEEGPRRFHGNFTWQNIICAYLMLLTTSIFLMNKMWNKKQPLKKMIVLWGIFGLHFLSGLLYLFKIYFTGSYH